MVNRNSENNITEAVTRRVKRQNDDLNSSTHQNLTSNHEKQIGILVVGHGSRREEANADVREAARLIARRGS